MKKLLAIFLLFIFLAAPALAQTAAICGDEKISLGSKGEVKLKLQTNGTDSSTNCWPSECSLKFYTASTTVISDKYLLNGTETFIHQKFCIANADEIKAFKCSSKISNETKKCAPAVCGVGLVEIGLLDEKRDFSEGNWTQNVFRLCVKGNIENATTIFKEQTGSFAEPDVCPTGFENTGAFKEIHFNETENYRAWRICVKYSAAATTTTTKPTLTLEQVKSQALSDLAKRLNISVGEIKIESAQKVTWGDSAIGCPKEGFGYSQAIVPGYRVVLFYNNVKYYYHSALSGEPFLCEKPEPSVEDRATTTTKITTTTLAPTTTFYTTTTFYPYKTTQSTLPGCNDSDDGISIYQLGTVKDPEGKISIDGCLNNQTLNEFYCSDTNVSIFVANCTSGCVNGACVQAGSLLAEKGAALASKIIDNVSYLIDLIAQGKILEKGIALVSKGMDMINGLVDLLSKLVGKGSQYADTIVIPNASNATNATILATTTTA
ncbi:MAG TPA: hypothetical protein VI933_00440 [archaeon]|nr:hypothetical protein [archaeon]